MMTKNQLKAARALAASEKALFAADAGVSLSTMNAMARRGLIQKVERAYWSPYKLTDAGRRELERIEANGGSLGTKEVEVGRCQCCLRPIVIEKGKVVRHGWHEAGGRRRGEIGCTWHVGQCRGSGNVPYEVSCELTKTFIRDTIMPAVEFYIELVKRYRARGPVTTTVTSCPRTGEYFCQRRGDERSVTLLPPVEIKGNPGYEAERQAKVYESVLKRELINAEGQMDAAGAELRRLMKAWREWRPELKTWTEKR